MTAPFNNIDTALVALSSLTTRKSYEKIESPRHEVSGGCVMEKRTPSNRHLQDYREAIREAKQGIQDFDYIGTLDRFRHRGSGDLFKGRAVFNLHWQSFPNRMNVDDALYTSALGVRQYAALTFIPGESENVVLNGQLCLNTWQRPCISPREGDPRLFLEFVALIFDDDPIAMAFFLDAIATLIQYPDQKWAFMILLIGAQGVGKSLVSEMVADLVGRRNTAFPTIEAIKGNFTGWLLAHLVVIHELDQVNREIGTRIKHWVTSDTLMINTKNVPEYSIKNYANLIACSNHEDVAYLDSDDRRIFSWISQAEKRPPAYYEKLCEWFFKGPGAGIVLGFLKNRDISGFNPKAAPPKTHGRERLIENSRTEAERFLRDALDSGAPPFSSDICTAGELLQYLRVHQIRVTDAEVRHFLRQQGTSLGQVRIQGTRPSIWVIRNHAHWAKATPEEIALAYVSAFDQAQGRPETSPNAKQVSAPMPLRKSGRAGNSH